MEEKEPFGICDLSVVKGMLLMLLLPLLAQLLLLLQPLFLLLPLQLRHQQLLLPLLLGLEPGSLQAGN